MTNMNILWVFLGGGLGSILRYGINNLVGSSHNFPLATLIANFLASLVLGILFGISGNDLLSDRQKLIFMTGFCGGFSTFSTFSLENYNLLDSGNFLLLALNILLSVVVCLVGVWLGFRIAA